MTFANFESILIFETKKVIIWFLFEAFIKLFITYSGTARPRDTRFLVPEKNRAAQNRAS